jgi:hypothetical protein
MIRGASGAELYWLIAVLLEGCPQGMASGVSGMRALGAYLEDLAALPEREFRQLLERQVRMKVEQLVEDLVARAQDYGDGRLYWLNDLKKWIDVLRSALEQNRLIIPVDLLRTREREDACWLMQRITRQYGQLLHHWPAIFEAARTLRDSGQGLAISAESEL